MEIFVLASIVIGGIAFYWVYKSYKAAKQRDFVEIFGFDPFSYADEVEAQYAVDQALKTRAANLAEAWARFNTPHKGTCEYIGGYICGHVYRGLYARVRVLLLDFIGTQTLAKGFGFTVRERFTDYPLRS